MQSRRFNLLFFLSFSLLNCFVLSLADFSYHSERTCYLFLPPLSNLDLGRSVIAGIHYGSAYDNWRLPIMNGNKPTEPAPNRQLFLCLPYNTLFTMLLHYVLHTVVCHYHNFVQSILLWLNLCKWS